MFISNNQLNEQQIEQVDALVALCQQKDCGVPVIYRPLLLQKRISENNVLGYIDNQLVGFLSVFFFYEQACEISLLVHPDYRGKKIAQGLIQYILPLLHLKEMDNIIFSILPSTDENRLKKLGFNYHNTEYHMQRHSKIPVSVTNTSLIVRKAVESDLFGLCAIDELCFTNHHGNMYVRLKNVLNDPAYTLLIAVYKKIAVDPTSEYHTRKRLRL